MLRVLMFAALAAVGTADVIQASHRNGSEVEGSCYLTFHVFGDSLYALSDPADLRTWQDARTVCQECQGTLAKPENQFIQNHITASIVGEHGYWFDLTYDTKHREWRYSTGATPSYQDWARGCPYRGNGNCAEFAPAN